MTHNEYICVILLFSDNVEAFKLLTEAPEIYFGSGVFCKSMKINCEIGSRHQYKLC